MDNKERNVAEDYLNSDKGVTKIELSGNSNKTVCEDSIFRTPAGHWLHFHQGPFFRVDNGEGKEEYNWNLEIRFLEPYQAFLWFKERQLWDLIRYYHLGLYEFIDMKSLQKH